MAFDPSVFGRNLSAWLGPKLSRVRLNRIEPRIVPGQPPRIAKRRRWFSAGMIGPGNLYLRWLDAKVVVLPCRRWHDWECEVHRRLYGIECAVDSAGWLILPLWPGDVLAQYGADTRIPRDDRVRALSAATDALRGLHRVEWPLPAGPLGQFSHGDATLRNVIYDRESCQAHWFDFDTIHDLHEPAIARHGDDLRALLYSALETFSDIPVAVLLETIRTTYGDPAVWDQLQRRLARGGLHTSPFHFAQAAPPAGRRDEVERLLTGRA